ncbi:MAG: hypothetical protein QXU97_01240 [Fervidicoccaceae archaeon]
MKVNCDVRFHDVLEFSECAEHPFLLIAELLRCLSDRGGEYVVRVPAGSIPHNVLQEYADRYGAAYTFKRDKTKLRIGEREVEIDTEVYFFSKR